MGLWARRPLPNKPRPCHFECKGESRMLSHGAVSATRSVLDGKDFRFLTALRYVRNDRVLDATFGICHEGCYPHHL